MRVVQTLCSEGRVPGAKKFGNSWMLPADAEKPADPRRERRRLGGGRPAYALLTASDLPIGNPSRALTGLPEAMRPLAEADIAFRQGNPQPAIALWRTLPTADDRALSAASLATAAAISTGDYGLFDEIQFFLQDCMRHTDDPRERALLSLPGTLAAVSMALPSLTSDWLKACDFSLFERELRPFLLFLYAMHLRNIGQHEAALAVGRTTLALTEKGASFTWLTVYLGALCANAAFALGDEAAAKAHLAAALALAMPYGMIAPFADYLGSLGGLVEAEMAHSYPAYEKPTVALWSVSFKNWMGFHNTYAREHITTLLLPREYHVARLLAGGATYAEAGRRLHLSPGRVKNIASTVYLKLQIGGRQDLGPFIL